MPGVVSSADVVLVTRQGCHLCEQAKPVVAERAAQAGATVRVVDVDADRTLRERFTDHVPVLFVGGRLLDYWTVDGERLASALRGDPVDPPAPL